MKRKIGITLSVLIFVVLVALQIGSALKVPVSTSGVQTLPDGSTLAFRKAAFGREHYFKTGGWEAIKNRLPDKLVRFFKLKRTRTFHNGDPAFAVLLDYMGSGKDLNHLSFSLADETGFTGIADHGDSDVSSGGGIIGIAFRSFPVTLVTNGLEFTLERLAFGTRDRSFQPAKSGERQEGLATFTIRQSGTNVADWKPDGVVQVDATGNRQPQGSWGSDWKLTTNFFSWSPTALAIGWRSVRLQHNMPNQAEWRDSPTETCASSSLWIHQCRTSRLI